MKIPAGSLVPFAFVAVAVAWAIAKADRGMSPAPEPSPSQAAIVQAVSSTVAASPSITPAVATSPAATSASPAGPRAEPATPAAATPVPSSPPTTQPQASPPPASTATAYAANPVAPSGGDEITATNTLHQLGKAYLQALIDNNPAPIAAMLASRCTASDPSAILARRRAEVAAEAGVPIETIVAIAPVVAHLDLPGAEAHTVIQFDVGGQRHTLASADGWVLEGGAWRNAEC